MTSRASRVKSKPGSRKVIATFVSEADERRILILAPTGNDAQLTAAFLKKAKLSPCICANVSDLCTDVRQGCGAILLAEETLSASSIFQLIQTLEQQPIWSDIPVTIITSGGEASRTQLRRLALFGPSGNVAILERPFRPSTLISTLEVALRARRRQYEIRELMQTTADMAARQEAQARWFDTTLSSLTDLAYTFDLEGNWIYANKPLLRLWGKSLEEITGKSSLQLGYPPELAERLKQQVKEVIRTRRPFKGETLFKDAAGVEDYHEYIFSPIFGPDGNVSAVCGTTRLTTERKRAEAAAESQRRVLQLMVEDAPLEQVLDELVRKVEFESARGALASVLLLDCDGIHLRLGAGPNLPLKLRKVLHETELGPHTTPCGTAAFLKKPVWVGDIAKRHLWKDYKKVILASGLRSCWSHPILSINGDVLGTFALYHAEPRQKNDADLRILEIAIRTAAIAIGRKLTDAAIRDSQQRYGQLVHSLPTALYTTDSQGRITLFNEAAATLWGRRPQLGKDVWSGAHRLHYADETPLPLDQSPMAVTVKEGRPVRGEEVVVERPDGTRRLVRPYTDPIRDVFGKVVGAVNMLLDVTDSKQAEDAMRRLAAIVESSDDAIISKDLNGVIMTWNRGAEKLFGYKTHEIVGKPITILIPPEHLDEEPGILEKIRHGESIEHYETVRVRKDGSKVEIALTVSPIRDASGKIIGASKIARDISNQKEADRKLERAHNEAVAASRAKDDFLAALSHELRTPLNPVLLLASEAAENRNLPDDIRGQFATIRNNVELESRLIDDLLDMTRITHGKISMNMNLVDVHDLLNGAIQTVQSELELKHIELVTQLAAERMTVNVDSVRLQQVFWNVLKNAAKFTPERGKIKVASYIGRENEIIVEIADTGIGLDAGEAERIFAAFAQGEHGNVNGAHRFGGLGLGLAISRKLMELHHGKIWATSAGKNMGTTFSISIPLAAENAAPKTKKGGDSFSPDSFRNGNGRPYRVLLVEDHEPTRTALTQLLQRRHYDVDIAASAAEARLVFDRHDFELLISDIGLPDGSGLDLMKEFQTRNHDLRGIALTGYGMEQDIIKTQEAGFGVHLTKPIRVQSLESALSTVAKKNGKSREQLA